MKHKELFESILEEGISPVVYHVTGASNFIRMMQTNTFKLGIVDGRQSLEFPDSKNHMFYLSTARTKQSSFISEFVADSKWTSTSFAVILKLDGRALSRHNRGTAMVYGRLPQYREEMEDRIISDHPRIPNASSYIVSADIVVNLNDPDQISTVQKVITILKEKRIPFYVYKDTRAALISNTSKALNDKQVDALMKLSMSNSGREIEQAIDDSYHDEHPAILETRKKLRAIQAFYRLAFMNDYSHFNNEYKQDHLSMYRSWIQQRQQHGTAYILDSNLRAQELTNDVAKIAKLVRRQQAASINELLNKILNRLEEKMT